MSTRDTDTSGADKAYSDSLTNLYFSFTWMGIEECFHTHVFILESNMDVQETMCNYPKHNATNEHKSMIHVAILE